MAARFDAHASAHQHPQSGMRLTGNLPAQKLNNYSERSFNMSVLYVLQPEAVLVKPTEAFTVAMKQEDGSWKKHSVPAQTWEQ